MAETHPLNAADEARSIARIADIQLGLASERDRDFWLGKLDARISALEEDGEWLGLAPHEEAELARLKTLKKKAEANG